MRRTLPMPVQKRWIVLIVLGLTGAAAVASRASVGRENACWVALYSFDDGPGTFEHTYKSGAVGPFVIGQSKDEASHALSSWPEQFILPMEMSKAEYAEYYLTENSDVSPQMRSFLNRSDRWTVAIRTESCGGSVIYEPFFVRGRMTQVKAFYSVFAGL